MEVFDNQKKYENYKIQKAKLKKALANDFYFEAVLIEYAIFEDRAESVLRHAGGIKLVDSRGMPLKLAVKLNKIRSCAPFACKYVRSRLTPELLDDVGAWRDQRNKLVHAMMKQPYDEQALRAFAEQGDALLKQFDSKVRSVNNYFDKINADNA